MRSQRMQPRRSEVPSEAGTQERGPDSPASPPQEAPTIMFTTFPSEFHLIQIIILKRTVVFVLCELLKRRLLKRQ